MTVTVEDLALSLGFAATPADTVMLDRALASSRAMLEPHLIQAPPTTGDLGEVWDQAVLKCAQTLWRSKDAAGGTYVFGDGTDMNTGLLPRDPVHGALPMLQNAGLAKAAVVA